MDFAGGLKLSNTVQLAILQHKIDLGGEQRALAHRGVHPRREPHVGHAARPSSRADVERATSCCPRRSDRWPFSERNRLQVRACSSRADPSISRARSPTPRATAPWANRPFVETGERHDVDIAPAGRAQRAWRLRRAHLPPVGTWTLEGGDAAAGGPRARRRRPTRSARPPSWRCPPRRWRSCRSGWRPSSSPTRSCSTRPTATPTWRPSGRCSWSSGIEQPLPFQALLRLEGFVKWLDHLTVNPDTPEGLPALRDAGLACLPERGPRTRARGGRAAARARPAVGLRRGARAGLLGPRPTRSPRGVQTYPAPWDQRFTASANVSFTPDRVLAAHRSAARFHTGRPVTPVLALRARRGEPALTCRSSATPTARATPASTSCRCAAEKRFTLGAGRRWPGTRRCSTSPTRRTSSPPSTTTGDFAAERAAERRRVQPPADPAVPGDPR